MFTIRRAASVVQLIATMDRREQRVQLLALILIFEEMRNVGPGRSRALSTESFSTITGRDGEKVWETSAKNAEFPWRVRWYFQDPQTIFVIDAEQVD